jgi:peptidyl-prolyl cis-trans isomerase B (cyclophilin B)
VSTTIGRTAVLAVTLAALGCGNDASPIRNAQAQAQDPPQSGDPVQLAVTAAKNEVALGDDIVLHFKLTNGGKSEVQVNVPRLDKRSVSLRVRTADGNVGTVTRLRAELSQRGEFVWDTPEVKTLAPGESLEQDVTTVAIQSGAVTITPSYTRQGAPTALVSSPIEVKVTPKDAKAPRLGVKLETSHGSYTAVFRPDVAYNTVESFATLVKRGFYSGLKFHRIIKGFMAQGGDPKGTGEGGPGYFLPLEANLKLRHTRGVMSMARTGIPDTAGSQFFIMFATRPDLDAGRYTTFAEMKDGEETLKKLESVPVAMSGGGEPSVPKETVQVQTATLVTLP